MATTRTSAITWHERPRSFAADPAATIALDEAAWTRLGARFASLDDELGDTARRATATVTANDGSLSFGVLDHGEDTTFVLVPPGDWTASTLLAALREAGVRPVDVLELLPAPPPGAAREASEPVLVKSTTPAQQRVLAALARPLVMGGPDLAPASNAQIATELVLSVDTVKRHMHSLYSTFGLGDVPARQKRLMLAAIASRSGLSTRPHEPPSAN